MNQGKLEVVKQQMARVNVDILGIRKLNGLEWVNLTQVTIITTTAGRNPLEEMEITASGPITSWQIDGETVADFIFLGSKITADGDCSHEIKRCLLLGRKVNKKQRHYSVNKGPSNQGYGFSSGHVWM